MPFQRLCPRSRARLRGGRGDPRWPSDSIAARQLPQTRPRGCGTGTQDGRGAARGGAPTLEGDHRVITSPYARQVRLQRRVANECRASTATLAPGPRRSATAPDSPTGKRNRMTPIRLRPFYAFALLIVLAACGSGATATNPPARATASAAAVATQPAATSGGAVSAS